MIFQIMKVPANKVLNKQKDFIFENVKPGFKEVFDLDGHFTDIEGKYHQFNKINIEIGSMSTTSMKYIATLHESDLRTTHTTTSMGRYGLNVARGISFCMGGSCSNEKNQYYAAGITVLDYDPANGAKIKITIYEPAETTDVKDMGNKGKLNINTCLITEINPNPATEVAQIGFSISSDSKIWLRVYDALGNAVANLFDGKYTQGGNHSIDFNVSNLNSGVYYIQLSDGKHQHSVPLVVN